MFGANLDGWGPGARSVTGQGYFFSASLTFNFVDFFFFLLFPHESVSSPKLCVSAPLLAMPFLKINKTNLFLQSTELLCGLFTSVFT